MDTDDLPDEDQHSGKEVNGESLIADTASRSPAHSSHHSDQNTDESDSDESIEDSPKRGVKRKCDDNGIDHPKAKLEKLESEQNDTDDDDAEEPNKTEDKSEDDTASESSKTKDDDPKDDTKLSEQADSESEDETNSEIQSEIKEETIADDKNLLDTLEDDNQNFKPAETQLTEIKIDTDIASKPKTPTVKSPTEATRQSLRANRNSNPAAFLVKKPKLPTDMSNPAYRKPFNYGWKRELVYRANSENSVKRNGDIYYFTPDGKKVRSMREVIENLRTKDLSTDNFTFYKEPLGIDDPELEIIRVAKVKGSSSTTPSSLSGKKKFKTKKEPKSTEKQSVKAGKSPKFGSAFKVKLSGARLSQGKRTATPGKGEKKSKATKSPMQIGMLPPGWQSPKKTEKLAKTHAEDRSLLKSKRTIRRNSAQTPQPAIKPDVEKEKFMQNFFAHLSTGYTVLIQVFQYLKVQELLRASRVCRMWRDIAAHSSLWRIVRMKNSQVRDWQGLATSLRRHETRTLDLRKMLIPDNGEEIWPVFSKALTMVESLTRLDLCRCPGTVVEELARSNPRLEIINATILRCDSLDLSTYNRLENLQELRLKSQNGTDLNSDLSVFKSLRKLNHLSLLSIKELGKKQVDVLGELGGLQTLELGECADLPENFGSDVLSKLVKLERLRLEKGPTTTCTHNILETVSELRHMEQLELVNFDVKTGFDKAIETCTNIKRLLLIPTYISQSATTNHMVLSGVLQLSDSLTHFTWGVTLELLRVTELFVDQCDQAPKKKSSPKKEKKISGDSIPILKPVPFLQDITDEHAQVEILPIPKLQKLLTNKMEDTKVKILKIPFHATWRQTISDLVQ